MTEVKSHLVVTDDYGNTFDFVREHTCSNVAATPEDTFTCSSCGVTLHLDHDLLGYGTPIVDYTRGFMDDNPRPIKKNNYCPNCGGKVEE